MKAVILAAGYGTRLQRDVSADRSGRFAHLIGVAKPLLPVGDRALLSHWIGALSASDGPDAIYVVSNALYLSAFEEWAAHFPNVKIVCDQTTSNDGRLGAVACLQLAVKHFHIQDHVMVIGGDTLFKEDFSLAQIQCRFRELQAECEDNNVALSYECRDDETPKYGIVEVDPDLRALRMKEKPLPSETTSRRACPCFYVLSKKSLPLLDAFLLEKKDAAIEQKDAPGNFMAWLIPRKPVYVQEICGRFDVGNLQSRHSSRGPLQQPPAALRRLLAPVLHFGDARAKLHGPLGKDGGGPEAQPAGGQPQQQFLADAPRERQVGLVAHGQRVEVAHHALVQVGEPEGGSRRTFSSRPFAYTRCRFQYFLTLRVAP
ncbi:uncharacterized protein zgc:136439 [Syngnathus typhle]|uniref:uncharacterized protein zgc:136439 n=1 Tax=Syngnathus typhle TaxID=161592 RepID=UPI002A6A9B18|nr:uncharacterized protein zgc:136439 [Syngnathus typhle]